jgi:uncharacterized repeat protein (TIGR04076 family)
MIVPELGLTYRLSPPKVAGAISVTSEIGTCPRGLSLGDVIEVDADGRLSAPVCKAAAAALGPVMTQVNGGQDSDAQVRCECPLAGRGLTFSVQPVGHQEPDRETAPLP